MFTQSVMLARMSLMNPESVRPGAEPDRGSGRTVLAAAALGAELADELVLATVRDTHASISDRVHGLLKGPTGGASAVPEAVHRGIAGIVYGSIGLGLRGVAAGCRQAAAYGPGMDDHPAGRYVTSAVNGLVGDRLTRDRPELALAMTLRVDGRDVTPSRAGLGSAYPGATGRVVVFLHGLCESEEWWFHDTTRASYPDVLAARGWTPVMLRANTGLPLRENGVALASLMDRLVAGWPVPVTRIALIGHSMGGLVMRAAGAVTGPHESWAELVSDVITLGTPHLGSPVARAADVGSRALGVLPETRAFGRILDQRSVGIRDLVAGLGDEVAPFPGARYRLVSAGRDVLVRRDSASGRDRIGDTIFPGCQTLHVKSTGHFGLLNHLDVHAALARWLA